MNTQKIKQYAWGMALMVGLVLASGLSNLSAAQAQGRWGQGDYQQNQRRNDRRDDRWDRRDDRRDDRWDERNGDYQQGLRDGLRRGQEDLRDRRAADPNNSSHYRKGNNAYREGFRRGYAQGYRSYRRW
jgi:hypothetical protein